MPAQPRSTTTAGYGPTRSNWWPARADKPASGRARYPVSFGACSDTFGNSTSAPATATPTPSHDARRRAGSGARRGSSVQSAMLMRDAGRRLREVPLSFPLVRGNDALSNLIRSAAFTALDLAQSRLKPQGKQPVHPIGGPGISPITLGEPRRAAARHERATGSSRALAAPSWCRS